MIVMEYEGRSLDNLKTLIRKDVDINELIQEARDTNKDELDITLMPLGTELNLNDEDINDIDHLTGRAQEYFCDILEQGHFAYNLTIGDRKFQIEASEVIRSAFGSSRGNADPIFGKYLDSTNTWREECGCTEASVLDNQHPVCGATS